MRKARCLLGTNAPSLEEKRSARPEPSPPRPEKPLALDGVKFDMSAWGKRVEEFWKERESKDKDKEGRMGGKREDAEGRYVPSPLQRPLPLPSPS